MADIKEMYKNFGISEDVYDYSVKITDALKQRFQEIDIIAEYNQLKVVNAMQKIRYQRRILPRLPDMDIMI